MPTKYPDVLQGLLDVVGQFRAHKIPLNELQQALWEASGTISLPEERGLSETLMHAEGRLEEIQFTIDSEKVLAEAEVVVRAVEDRIKAAMAE